MNTPINTKISPALDPATYSSVEGYNEETKGYVDDVVSVMQDVYVTLGKICDAKALADSNPVFTEDQRLLVVGKEAAKQKDRLAQRLDRASTALDDRIAFTEAALRQPVEQAAVSGPLAAEVRAHCKGLDRTQRSKLLNEALAAGDEATLHAILGGQPFLSGLTAEDRTYFLEAYHAKKTPALVARLEVMRRVRSTLDRSGANGPAFHRSFDKAVGAPAARVRAIDTANEAALAALRIEPTL